MRKTVAGDGDGLPVRRSLQCRSVDSSTAIIRDVSAARLLRDARRKSGLSQRALARAVGVPHSTVARIELGRLSPRADTLERLMSGCGRALATERAFGLGIDRS